MGFKALVVMCLLGAVAAAQMPKNVASVYSRGSEDKAKGRCKITFTYLQHWDGECHNELDPAIYTFSTSFVICENDKASLLECAPGTRARKESSLTIGKYYAIDDVCECERSGRF